MNKKIIIFCAALLIIFAVCIGWLQKINTLKNGSLQKVVLQLKWLHQAQFAGFYAADQLGYYKDEGLDVSIAPIGDDLSEKSNIDRVSDGTVQFIDDGGDQVILARAAGKPIKAVAVIYQQSPVAMMSLQSAGIKTLHDLMGKRIGVWPEQNTQVVYHAMLKSAGVDGSKIKEINIPFGFASLTNGTVDAQMVYLTNEALSAKEEGDAVNLVYPQDYGVELYADTLITSDALIQQNPDLVQRFVRASIKGWNWAVTYPDLAGAMALRYDPSLNEAHQVSMMWASLPLIYTGKAPIGSMDAATWKKTQDLLLGEKGLLKAPVPLDDIFTTRFL